MPSGDTDMTRARLKAAIAAKQIVRSGLNNAYDKLDGYEKRLKHLRKAKRDTTILDIHRNALEAELEKLEESIENSTMGTNIEAGGGFSGGSCAGGD